MLLGAEGHLLQALSLMTCHILFPSATIKKMHSASQAATWRQCPCPSSSPIKITINYISCNLFLKHFKKGYLKSACINSHITSYMPFALFCFWNISVGQDPWHHWQEQKALKDETSSRCWTDWEKQEMLMLHHFPGALGGKGMLHLWTCPKQVSRLCWDLIFLLLQGTSVTSHSSFLPYRPQ